ncbi:LytR/AlgR family response regulator transcription factor [Chitinophaga defluvii]|uniref:LytTR family transcriptional regulator DNA-binding domain-containing protein n=1 Tax=Chitinophaga defluvii TaxID=3163343 RepID=A0ABV2TFW8_9BACT
MTSSLPSGSKLKLNCIIIGDNPPGMPNLDQYASQTPFIFLANRYASVADAYVMLSTELIHVVLLGQNVPETEEFFLMDTRLENTLPFLILSYPDNSSQPFTIYSMDLLQAPFTFERFLEVAQRVYNLIYQHATDVPPKKYDDHFMIACEDNQDEKIYYDQLQVVEVLNDFIHLHTLQQIHTTQVTLDWITAQLPASLFMRVHSWYIINFNFVTEVSKEYVMLGHIKVPIMANVSAEVAKRFKRMHGY